MEIEALKEANEMAKAGKLKGKVGKPSKSKHVLQNQIFDEAAEISKYSSILHPDDIPKEMRDHPLAKAKLYYPPVRKGPNKMFLLREKHRKQKLIRQQEKLERMKQLESLQPKAIKVKKQFTKVFRDPITNPTAKVRRAALSNFAAFSEIQHQFEPKARLFESDLGRSRITAPVGSSPRRLADQAGQHDCSFSGRRRYRRLCAPHVCGICQADRPSNDH
jgi:hypothetical protein